MLGARIAEARKRAGLLQVDLAVALGDPYDQSVISRVEAGERSLRPEGIATAAQELSVSTDYLLGLTDDPTPYARLTAELDVYRHERTQPTSFHDPAAVIAEDAEVPSVNARYIEIPEVEASAGRGRVLEEAPVTGHLAFQRTWLSRHSIDPNNATVITVAGASMEPTLADGSSILVDHNRHTRRRGRIYVIQTGDELMVKRAGREKSGWQLVSDNAYWPPAPWPEDARIVGEVRWAARTF